MKLYWNYRMSAFNKWNGQYSVSYLASQQFSDYAWIIDIRDMEIPENRYTKVNANGMKNLTKFLTYECAEWVDEVEFRKSVALIWSYNAISLFNTVEEARQDVRDRTDLEEVEEWKFLISPATDDWIDWPTEAKYLIID